MQDYVYPSVFLAYFMFLIFLVGAIYFMIRSYKDGYWGAHSEDAKYHVFEGEEIHNGR